VYTIVGLIYNRIVVKAREVKNMNNQLRGVKAKRSTAFKDLVRISIIFVPLFTFASFFRVFERFAEFHQECGVGPIDDFIIVFAALTIGFAIFSLRRWREFQKALGNVRTLQGLIPICASCKKIRDDIGYRNQLEFYIETHSEAELIHTICPKCVKKLYGITRPADGQFRGSASERNKG
jgi:hypothetical protein